MNETKLCEIIILLLKQSQQKSWNITNYWLVGIFMKLWGSAACKMVAVIMKYMPVFLWRNATLEYLQVITKKRALGIVVIYCGELCPNKRPICKRKKNSGFSRAYNFTIRPVVVQIHLTNVYNINFVHQARLNYKKKQLLNRFLVQGFSID